MSQMQFEQFYCQELVPLLSTFESQRRRMIRSFLSFLGIGLLAASALSWVISTNVPEASVLILVIFAVLFILFPAYWRYHKLSFAKAFKYVILQKIIHYIEPSLSYDPEHAVASSQFHQARLFNRVADRYEGEDYFYGKVGDTDIEFSELHAQYQTNSVSRKGVKTKSWNTIFKGVFFVGDFHKHFNGITLIFPERPESLHGVLGRFFQPLNFFSYKALVNLEDEEFEKEFAVYGSDQIEARYILSPSLMQRVLHFKRKTGCPVYLSFVDSKVFVGIANKRDLFEPKIFSSLTCKNLIKQYIQDLELIVGIVDDLKLNTRIWSKR